MDIARDTHLVYSPDVSLAVTELTEDRLTSLEVQECQADGRRHAATLAHGADYLLVL